MNEDIALLVRLGAATLDGMDAEELDEFGLTTTERDRLLAAARAELAD